MDSEVLLHPLWDKGDLKRIPFGSVLKNPMFTFMLLLLFLVSIFPNSCMTTKDMGSVRRVDLILSSKPHGFWLIGLPKAKGTILTTCHLTKNHMPFNTGGGECF